MKYIQENSREPLDVSTIAEIASFSPYHFHRIFSNYVGETLAEYIKKVRLKKAASLLLDHVKISEAAIESGYWTNSAFSKAFKQTFGMTPSDFKSCGGKEKINISTRYSVKINQNIIMQPRIVEEPSFKFFYIRLKLNKNGLLNENLGKSFHVTFNTWYTIIESLQLWGHVFRRMGVIRGLSSVNPERNNYDAGFVFNTPVDLHTFKGNGVEVTEIKQGKWAVFLHKGPYNTLWQSWSWIFNYWFSVSGFEIGSGECFEVYLNYKNKTHPENLRTEIYIPVH